MYTICYDSGKHIPLHDLAILTALVRTCSRLSDITLGTVDAPVTTYQGIATYACSEGYEIVGDGTRTCQSDRAWNGSKPTCAFKSSSCNINFIT